MSECIQEHQKHSSSPPTYIAQAPGRINIIGEHTDYMDYPVLPMCIPSRITVCVSAPTDSSRPYVSIQNVDTNKYPTQQYKQNECVKVEAKPVWTNYVVAALLGVVEYHKTKDVSQVGQLIVSKEGVAAKDLRDMGLGPICLTVGSDLIADAGLSSSSALVVACVAAISKIWDVKIPHRLELAYLTCNTERHIGLCGGGMDQTVISSGKAGTAWMINFNPIELEAVPQPPEVEYVIVDSFESNNKIVGAPKQYNKRVFECRIAAFLMFKALKPDDIPDVAKLRDLTLRQTARELQIPLLHCPDAVDRCIPSKSMTKEEVLACIGDDRLDALLKSRIGAATWEQNEDFEPYQRAKHVFEEAIRVHKFVEVCKADTDSETKIEAMGKLLNESDVSLHTLYDCGTAHLRRLSAYSRACGALGCRLTGAGWGGATISLVRKSHVPAFIEQMTEFCQKYKQGDVSEGILVACPADGVTLFDTHMQHVEKTTQSD